MRALPGCGVDEAAHTLVGEYDFRAFTPTETQHKLFVRVVSSARWLEVDEDVLAFEITADSFLRHMVRTLVGTMLARRDVVPLLERGQKRLPDVGAGREAMQEEKRLALTAAVTDGGVVRSIDHPAPESFGAPLLLPELLEDPPELLEEPPPPPPQT